MKPGDLVRQKYITLSALNAMEQLGNFSRVPVLVMERHLGAIKVLLPDGNIRTDIASNYEVISECD